MEGDVSPTSNFHDRNVEWVEDVGLGAAGAAHRVDGVVLNEEQRVGDFTRDASLSDGSR